MRGHEEPNARGYIDQQAFARNLLGEDFGLRGTMTANMLDVVARRYDQFCGTGTTFPYDKFIQDLELQQH